MRLPSKPNDMTNEFLEAVEKEAVRPGAVFSGALVKVLTDQIRSEWQYIADLRKNVSEVYDHVTNGRVSNPNPAARGVIAQYDEALSEHLDAEARWR